MTKETVEDWFDRVMVENGMEPSADSPVGEIVLTEEDYRILLGDEVIVPPSYVYFDERSGAIRGVSHGLEDELSKRFSIVEVSADVAQGFMSGAADIGAWIVGYQGSGVPKLLPANVTRLTIVQASSSLTVVNDTDNAPVEITVVVPQEEPIGIVAISARAGLEIDSGMDGPFEILLCRKGIAEDIVARFSIDLTELIAKGEIAIDLGGIIGFEVDLLTRPLSSVRYRLQPFQEASRPLVMPQGRFVDFSPIEVTHRLSESPAGLVVDYFGDRVVVYLHGGGGRYYDRPLTALMLAFCQKGNPEALLFSARIPLDQLRAGPVSVPVSQPLGDFEILTPRYYVKTYFRNLIDAAPLPTPSGLDLKAATEIESGEPGLLVSVDPEGSVVLDILSGGGRRYIRETDTFMVTITEPEAVEFVLWTGMVNLIDLDQGPVRLDVPPEILRNPFAVYTQHAFENTFWRLADNEASRQDRIGDSQWLDRRERNSEVPPPCLGVWLERGRNLLRVQALNGGGDSDDRVSEMRIVVCSSRDPETMICTFKAPVQRLEQGDMLGFPLPVEWHPELVNGNFEVLVQSVYTSAYIFE
jgi:hypothetical protein